LPSANEFVGSRGHSRARHRRRSSKPVCFAIARGLAGSILARRAEVATRNAALGCSVAFEESDGTRRRMAAAVAVASPRVEEMAPLPRHAAS